MDLGKALIMCSNRCLSAYRFCSALQGLQQGDAATPPPQRGPMGAAEREPATEKAVRDGTPAIGHRSRRLKCGRNGPRFR
jgi:hypothetical protein